MTRNQRTTMELIEKVKTLLEESPANAKRHPFFERFAKGKSREEIERFAKQWYLAAYNHKRAFPFLPAITENDETRRELIEVLRDEYGNGDTKKVHAKLLQNFLNDALKIETPTQDDIAPEVGEFGKTTLEMWRDTDPVTAFGYHYALEHIAQDIHKAFYAGLKDYGFPEETLEYFKYHSTAEEEHAAIADSGFNRYASDERNHQSLLAGAEIGMRSLAHMWDGFDRRVFNTVSA